MQWLRQVSMAGPVPVHAPDLGPCWPWMGRTNDRGYAVISVGGRDRLLHREMYEQFHGPVPEGYQVDHLCHHWQVCKLRDKCPHRACGNPAHWLAVLPGVNNLRSGSPTAENARKTHCWRGHALEGDNLRVRLDRPGHRECLTCHRFRKRLARLMSVVTAGGQGQQLELFG